MKAIAPRWTGVVTGSGWPICGATTCRVTAMPSTNSPARPRIRAGPSFELRTLRRYADQNHPVVRPITVSDVATLTVTVSGQVPCTVARMIEPLHTERGEASHRQASDGQRYCPVPLEVVAERGPAHGHP